MDINIDKNAVATETEVQEPEKDNVIDVDSVDVANDVQQDEADMADLTYTPTDTIKSVNDEWITSALARTDIKWNIDKDLRYLLDIVNSDGTANEKYIKLISACDACSKHVTLAHQYCTDHTTVAKMIGREEEVYIISFIIDLFRSFNAFNTSDTEKFVDPVTVLTGLCSIISLIGETYYVVSSIDTSFASSEVSDAAKYIKDISNSVSQFYNDIGFTGQNSAAFAMDICHNITWNKKLAAWIEADL